MSTDRDPTTDQPLPRFYPGAVSCVTGAMRFLNIRDEFGTKKYGVTLASPNGRNFVIDQLEESSDGLVYAVGAAFQDYILRAQLIKTRDILEDALNPADIWDVDLTRAALRALADEHGRVLDATGGWERSRALAEQLGWR